jgi:hypothetical protein
MNQIYKKNGQERRLTGDTSDEYEEGGSDSCCACCKEKYSETKRKYEWIGCRNCEKWTHENCTARSEKVCTVFCVVLLESS